MKTEYFNFFSTVISLVSIVIATFSCYQTYRNSQKDIRPYVYLYLVSTKNANDFRSRFTINTLFIYLSPNNHLALVNLGLQLWGIFAKIGTVRTEQNSEN